jgi:hypothetical protein
MGLLTNMLAQLGQQQNQPAPSPWMGPATPTSNTLPAWGPQSTASWQDQLKQAFDLQNSSGGAFDAIGVDGVIDYAGKALMDKYGTNNLSDFRYLQDAGVDGGYRLDWRGRQAPTGLLGGFQDAARSVGIVSGAPASDASDGSSMTGGNPSDNLGFGVTWEGEGGTGLSLKRDPVTGLPRFVTGAQQSNETGDIISALAVLGGGIMAGGGLGALGTSANVGASAAGGAAATMGAAGSAGVLPASYFAGAGSALGAGAGVAGGAIGDSAMDLASQEAMNAYGGSAGMDAAQQAGIDAMTQSGIPTSMPTASDYSQYTQQMGGSPSTPGTFNPAMDSQAANVAIDAGGGSALSGYQAGGIPSVTVNGAAGGAGTSLFDSLSSKVGDMGVKDWMGLASTVGGAISGAQGQEGSSSSTRAMDPRMDGLFYGDLAPRTQGLLGSTIPQAQLAGGQLMAKGSGLLGQTAPNTATNPYATGILDDMQRRVGQFTDQRLQGIKGNFVGSGGLGGSRQGVAEAEAIKGGADNLAGQGFNFMGGLYNQDQNRLRQDWTIGSGLVNQGINTPFLPAQNASQIYSPFTGFGTTTNNTQQGGGWQGAVGGALAGASFGRNMGWW